MSTAFGRGLRRLFGIKRRRRRPYVYQYRPKIEAITLDPLDSSPGLDVSETPIVNEVEEKPVKKTVRKKTTKKSTSAGRKSTKKKTSAKKTASKKSPARKRTTKSKSSKSKK